jgi:DNA-binding NarL/FixJ family response regulator
VRQVPSRQLRQRKRARGWQLARLSSWTSLGGLDGGLGSPAMSTRLLIADDQAPVRAGFRKILESEPGLTVVAEAEDGLGAVDAAARSRPDIALMEIRMPRLDGIAATRRIVERAADRPRVVMLTTYGLDEYVYEALRAGASGFLLKDAPPEELIAASGLIQPGHAPSA